MSRSNRSLAILQLFEHGPPVRTVEGIALALELPTSTTYRHVRELVQAGFLDPVTGAGYTLGPGFIRYDRLLRQTDDLIRVASPIMTDLLDRTSQHATVILCRRFKDCVMCVHEVHGAQPHAPTAYERGVTMPLFLGATSKVILANLPDRTLKSVYQGNENTIRNTLGLTSWQEFKDHLRSIRRAGYALTESEVASGRLGLAAPVFRGDQLVASVSLVGGGPEAERGRFPDHVPHVMRAAAKISDQVSDQPTVVSR